MIPERSNEDHSRYSVEKLPPRDDAQGPKTEKGKSKVFAVIDARRLERECFIRSVDLMHPHLVFLGYPTVEAFLSAQKAAPLVSTIIMNIGGHRIKETSTEAELRKLVDGASGVPVVVLAETEELSEVLAVIDCGAQGLVSANVGMEAIIEAAVLTSHGGVYLPSNVLQSLRTSVEAKPGGTPDFGEQLTTRQAAVAEALRRGKPNKIIAYEMNMCESTVKVHIRNILKKLNATNRTEAAFKLNALSAQDHAREV